MLKGLQSLKAFDERLAEECKMMSACLSDGLHLDATVNQYVERFFEQLISNLCNTCSQIAARYCFKFWEKQTAPLPSKIGIS